MKHNIIFTARYGVARPGGARRGVARQGVARQGRVRQGKDIIILAIHEKQTRR